MHDEKSMFLIILERFYHFRPCERMRKHAFAGRNTQHTIMLTDYHRADAVHYLDP